MPEREQKLRLQKIEIEKESEKDIWFYYEQPDELPSFNKHHHLERSLSNQKSHLKALKKKKLLKPTPKTLP